MDFMASTVYNVHSLGPHCLLQREPAYLPTMTVSSSEGFFYLRGARWPARGCGILAGYHRAFSCQARGSSLKSPGSIAKTRACRTFSTLEEMKAVFGSCEAPCLKPILVINPFWGIRHRLLPLQTPSPQLPPPPHPIHGALQHSA